MNSDILSNLGLKNRLKWIKFTAIRYSLKLFKASGYFKYYYVENLKNSTLCSFICFVRCQRNSENFGTYNVQEVFTVRYEPNLYIQFTFIFGFKDSVRTQEVSLQIPTAETQVRSQSNSCETYDGHSVDWNRFSLHTSVFPPSVTFHKCFICIFILNTILTARTNSEALEPSNKQCSIGSRGAFDK